MKNYFEAYLNITEENRKLLLIYVPNRDENNNPIDGVFWVDKITYNLTLIFGGCSINYVDGLWAQKNLIIHEKTAIISSFFIDQVFKSNINTLINLFDDFCISTNQNTLLLNIDNTFYFYRPNNQTIL